MWFGQKIQIMPWSHCVKVAVALIQDEQNRLLITQRPHHASHGGSWEFPGGKLEADELAEAALIREIREEVGLEILQYQFLGEIKHQYATHDVQLIIFLVTHFSGTPSCREGQLDLRWIAKQDINYALFPEANRGILNLIQ
jgi:8-oxo-dGTP diphosphatase